MKAARKESFSSSFLLLFLVPFWYVFSCENIPTRIIISGKHANMTNNEMKMV